MYEHHTSFKMTPQVLRADPQVYLSPDAPVEAILNWLDTSYLDEEIDYIYIDTPDCMILVFDKPQWAAVTFAAWSVFITKIL
ncbi:hypothetical protein [Novosphingobium sp.]|jgi:hypothetical protein|uniref:hypothetical protein n=1 Tax=Novosphingobium sp. TaxID=1874826 RepID=UPI002FE0A73E